MRKIISLLLVLALALSLCACGGGGEGDAPTTPATLDEKIEQQLKNMTVEEKIAQMLIVYYTGDTADDTLLNVVKEVKPGGFILSGSNITTYGGTVDFVQALQNNSAIPMIISIDHEGGQVQRLANLTDIKPTNIPDMLSVGKTNDTEYAYGIGKVMAEELHTVGVNLDFAPVLDILPKNGKSFIGSRSFGSDPQAVSAMSAALAKGLEENGVSACYKHFPGHGNTATDSHTDLPVLNKTKDELFANELIPFQSAINNGAQFIMIGHIALPKVTGDNTPATLSRAIVTDLLRTEMGYDGLVVTDALNMGALTNQYSYEEIYVKAIEAGVDLLLMPNGSRKAVEIIKANVSEERIDQSVRRILKYKYTHLEQYTALDSTYLGTPAHQSATQTK